MTTHQRLRGRQGDAQTVAGADAGVVREGGRLQVWQPTFDDYQVPEPEGDADPDRIWGMREAYTVVHQFARARRVAPWAVLANVLARVVAATPPTVQLPPIIGGRASLNLFIGLVGKSGDGKDTARAAAEELLTIDGGDGYMLAPLGSGEGLSHMFMTLRKPRGADGKVIRDAEPELIQYNTAALVTVGEIDTLGALVGRKASTVMAQLRQAAMGEQLGFFYVDTAKRMIVPKHAYRLCLVAGIQPARAAVLFDDADGGTPQRFVWMPVNDRDAVREQVPVPRLLSWKRPELIAGHGPHEVKVCDTAVETILDARFARLRGDGDALDGHALLTRLKVGAAVGLLDRRVEVSEADWEIAGIVMEMSDMTRARTVGALKAETERANRAVAEAEAARASIVSSRADQERLKRVAQTVKRHLARLTSDGWESAGKLSTRVAGNDRDYFAAAVAALVDAGELDAEEYEYRGVETTRYRLRR